MSTVQKSVINEDEIDTVLESDIQFSGNLETAKSLLIKGRLSGTITCGDDLYIAATALVDADIRSNRIIIRGRLQGHAVAAESIQVLAGCLVEASLEAPEIIIENEEEFKGMATITGNGENA